MVQKMTEKMVIEFNKDNDPLHCNTLMQKAGGNPSGTKLCQKYKCPVCLRTWTNVKEPFTPEKERNG